MKRLAVSSIFGCVCALAVWGMIHHAAVQPPSGVDEPGESEDFIQRRANWIENMHAHAPRVDWRVQDANTRARLRALRTSRLNGAAITATNSIAAAPTGTWHERGAKNWAGRVSDVDYDSASDRLTVFAHGGQLWRSQRANPQWQPLNDARRFEPYQKKQHFQRLIGNTERWLAADDTQHGLYYSDNQGSSWNAAGGFVPPIWYETTYLAARDIASNQIYATIASYDFDTLSFQARLLASSDRGASYTDLGFAGPYANLGYFPPGDQVALFAPGQGSNLVYLLTGSALIRIEGNNSPTTISTIPDAVLEGKVGLAGGIASGTGIPFLFAFFESSSGQTQVFRSLDGGMTWEARGTVPIKSYIRVAAGAALHDPNLVFYGGVDLYRSGDGGATFAQVSDWSEYFGNVATKLHADINFVRVFPDSLGNDVFFIGTDGGLFQSTDGLQTVSNLSLSGMRQSQYYDSYTERGPPYAISIGAQDQSYQHNSRLPSGIANYQVVIGGDYAHLTSSDGGETIWMNHPLFTLVNSSPSTDSPTLSTWDFSSDGHLRNTLFLPPLLADPSDPHVAWLGGGASSIGANHVIRLTWNGIGYPISSLEGSFDFGGPVTALAHSPQNSTTLYAMATTTSQGRASFFRTTTPDTDWSVTVYEGLPLGQYFYGNAVLPDPARANTIYIGGSGYSGPGVYVSTDNGDSFMAMDAGLPSTLIYSLASSPDGAHLFAATEVGPYYFDRTNSRWVDIGAGAPDSIYFNVDFVPALQVARFSTFGRGLWDFDLGGGDLIFREGFD